MSWDAMYVRMHGRQKERMHASHQRIRHYYIALGATDPWRLLCELG